MSKERLEEIIKQVKRSDEYAEKGLWAASDKKIVNLHNDGHINYLIERVEELEEENKLLKQFYKWNTDEGFNLMRQVNRYHELLEFYGNGLNYTWNKEATDSTIMKDGGAMARNVLRNG